MHARDHDACALQSSEIPNSEFIYLKIIFGFPGGLGKGTYQTQEMGPRVEDGGTMSIPHAEWNYSLVIVVEASSLL